MKSLFKLFLGVVYLVFGINGFAKIIPDFSSYSLKAEIFMKVLVESNFVMPVIYAFCLITGSFLLLNIFVPLFLLISLPLVINYFLFHYFLNGELFLSQNMIIPLIINFLHITLFFFYFPSYRTLLKFR